MRCAAGGGLVGEWERPHPSHHTRNAARTVQVPVPVPVSFPASDFWEVEILRDYSKDWPLAADAHAPTAPSAHSQVPVPVPVSFPGSDFWEVEILRDYSKDWPRLEKMDDGQWRLRRGFLAPLQDPKLVPFFFYRGLEQVGPESGGVSPVSRRGLARASLPARRGRAVARWRARVLFCRGRGSRGAAAAAGARLPGAAGGSLAGAVFSSTAASSRWACFRIVSVSKGL